MADDRSLDEFLGGESDDEPDEETSERPGDAPQPAVSTVAFDPDGAPCAACGELVRRRWRDDGALVCGDCKAW